MTRESLSTDNRAEASKSSVRLAEFVEIQFPGGTIRVTTAPNSITWGGDTYEPNPILRSAGPFSERADLKAERVVMTFSGLDATLKSRILSDKYHFASVNIWLGFFDETWSLVDDPHPMVSGLLLSNCTLGLDSKTGSISISADGWELFGQRDSAQLVTPRAQRERYAGDTGMDRVSELRAEEVVWGGSFQRA